MKIILSRKGFDSGYGGYPSLIMPNNEMITLPIPCSEDETKYIDLKTIDGKNIYNIMKDICKNIKNGKTFLLNEDTTCHLDPDLSEYSVNRIEGWKGCFGQISAAQKVLENNNIKEGDLFIFFGWFNDIEETNNKYKFKKGTGRHTLFGYLQIDKILYTSKEDAPEWLKKHPHAKSYRRCNKDSNCIYIAKEKCTFNKNIKGYGTFTYNEELDLTKKGMNRTKWDLPDIFKGLKMTYHNDDSWKEDHFKSACRGQEFVIEENKNIEDWSINLIEKYSTNKIKE